MTPTFAFAAAARTLPPALIPAQTSDTTTDTTEPSEAEVISEVGDAIASNGAEQWLWALLILVVAVVLSRLARSALTRVVSRSGSSSFLSDFLGRILGYIVMAFGLIYALESLGVQITPVLGALGLAGIAVAFALQSILENFVAGVLLQVRRPFEKGDEIESQDYVGVITEIDARTMTIRTPAGEVVRLPNAEVIRHPIVNLTQNGRRRTSLAVGVAYGTDVADACRIAREAAESVDLVLDDPAPVVVAEAFGASSIDLKAMFWHGPSIADKWKATDQVLVAITRAFERNDITIPFPQRTLHLAPDAREVLAPRTSGRDQE